MRAPILPAEFNRLVRDGAFEQIEGATVRGEVSFRGETIARDLRLLHVTFEGPVDFSDALIEGSLDLTGCWFCRTLAMRDCEVNGSLILDEVKVEARARGPEGRGFDWKYVDRQLDARGATVKGGIRAAGLTVMGNADFSQQRIHGDLKLAGLQVNGSLVLSGSTIDGEIWLIGLIRERHPLHGVVRVNLRATNLRVAGNVWIAGLLVQGACELWSARIEGNVIIENMRAGVHVCETQLHGGLDMGGSRVHGHLRLKGAQVSGAVQLFAAELGWLSVRADDWEHEAGKGFHAARIGCLTANGLRTHGDVRITDTDMTGDGAEQGPTVDLAHARIGGALAFWSPAPLKGAAPLPEQRRTSVVGDIDLSGARIEGDCDLTNLCVDGSVMLDDANVGGDLAFRSPVSLLAALRIRERNRDLFARLVESAGQGQLALPRASIRRLSMAMMTTRADVDLSGLEVRASDRDVRAHLGYGRIEARGVKVGGDLWLTRALDAEAWQSHQQARAPVAAPQSHVTVAGSVDLRGAEIVHFCLSAQPFQRGIAAGEPVEKAERERGILLSGATITELELLPLDGGRTVFPDPINLADVTVGQWNIGEGAADQHRRYCQLLDADHTPRRSTYLAVERSLRNRGLEAEADKVYRAMIRRGGGERQSFLPSDPVMPVLVTGAAAAALLGLVNYPSLAQSFAFWAITSVVAAPLVWWVARTFLWDALLGFGTAPLRIGAVIAALFAVSVAAVYADPRNVEPTLLAQIANRPPAEPAAWQLADALALGLRMHVPLVSWNARDQWQLAEEANRVLHVFGHAIDGVRPQDYGMLMMVLNFLAWPPFLAFALRRAFRSA